MPNSISAAMYQSTCMSYKPYPNFFIDGEPIESWFDRQIDLNTIDIDGNISQDDYFEIGEGCFARYVKIEK